METEARVAGFHPRTEIRSSNTQTIRPITPQSRRALRVGVAPRLRGAASSASTNPTKTRANPRAAPNRRRGSTALDHGKTIQASAGKSRQPRGDNRGITAHAAQPPQAAREQGVRHGASPPPRRLQTELQGSSRGEEASKKPLAKGPAAQAISRRPQGMRSLLQVRSSCKAQARADKQSPPQPQR